MTTNSDQWAGLPVCRTVGCIRPRRSHHLMCPPCWANVPEPIRAEVLQHHTPGSIRQSREYLTAIRAAIEAATAAPEATAFKEES